jgi:hypothetical protein
MMEDMGTGRPGYRRPPGARVPPGTRVPPTPGGYPRKRGAAATDEPTAEDQVDYPMPNINFDTVTNEPAYSTDPNNPIPYLDPLTGEDAKNDTRLTFLVAVILDAPPPAPPAPPPGEAPPEGEEPPAESASAQ